MQVRSFVSSLVVCVASALLLASVAQAQTICPAPPSADVTTWHNDNCRTGWQQQESFLTTSKPAVLHAFDAATMRQLYSSSGNNHLRRHATYPTPTIFNGRVYMGTGNVADEAGEVDVFA